MAKLFLDRAKNDTHASPTQYGVLALGIAAVVVITVLTLANA
jgi:Flp pilus assembly pilin Flp